MGTPLGPKYIPYTYMDPLGLLSAGILLTINTGGVFICLRGHSRIDVLGLRSLEARP